MKKTVLIITLLFMVSGLFAQKYITKQGRIDIFSETSLFTIEAVNKKVATILNTKNGEVVASTLNLSFEWEEALVGEHFNENYMESHKYPKAVFKGQIDNLSAINFKKEGTYNVEYSGDLTMHGVTNKIEEKGKMQVKDNKELEFTSTIYVSLAAYKIKVEESYKDRIKDKIELKMKFTYKPM